MRIISPILFVVFCALVFVLYNGCDTNNWAIGDAVCLKANGQRGTVTWFRYGTWARPTVYRVQSVNNLNQVYDAEILETDLENCTVQ